jgi:hypothetical protein
MIPLDIDVIVFIFSRVRCFETCSFFVIPEDMDQKGKQGCLRFQRVRIDKEDRSS